MPKVTLKGGTLLAPMPAALVSCGDMENSNLITVAWTGIINSAPPRTYISVRPERYSHEIISRTGEFVINLTTEKLAHATDYCGVKSGRDMDKFEVSGLSKLPAHTVKCPIVAESPLALECRVFDVIKLGSHDMFLADILSVQADSALMSGSGRLELDRAGLMCYLHGEYFSMGKKLGKFGYTVAKKKKK